MNFTASAGWGRARTRKGARRLQDLVRAPQLAILALKRLQALALGRRQAVAVTATIGLGLADPQPQRLAMHAEIARHMRDRPATLKDEANTPLTQLVRVLGRTRHPGRLSFCRDRSS
jgi:hypothetical protein